MSSLWKISEEKKRKRTGIASFGFLESEEHEDLSDSASDGSSSQEPSTVEPTSWPKKWRTVQESTEENIDNVSKETVFGPSFNDIEKGNIRRRGGRRSGTSSGVPKHLQSFMGEANLAYVDGRYEDAVKILLYIIREAPKVAAPYHTLSVIYESIGERQKALDVALIAAHLTPRDTSMWKRLAVLSEEMGNIDLAIYCLSKAVKASGRKDEEALRARANLYIAKGDLRRAAQGLEIVLRMHPEDTNLALEVAKYYCHADYPLHAINTLQLALDNAKDFHLELYEWQSRLLMEEGEYERAAALLSHARFQYFSREEPPFDLEVKLAICYIRLGEPHLADKTLRYLLQHAEGEQSLQYLRQFANAYTDIGYVKEASEICIQLLNQPIDNEEEIFLNLGRCYKISKKYSEALGWYQKVLDKDPGHVEACLGIAYIYEQIGELDRAAELVSKMRSNSGKGSGGYGKSRGDRLEAIFVSASDTVKSILERAEKYYRNGNILEFVEAVLPLLEASADPRMRSRVDDKATAFKLMTCEEENTEALSDSEGGNTQEERVSYEASEERESQFLLTFRRSANKEKKEKINNIDKKQIQFGIAEMGSIISTILGESAFVNLLERCWRSMCELGRNAEACRLVRSLIQSGQVQDEADCKRLRVLAVAGAYYGKDYDGAYEGVRNLCLERPFSISTWALLMRTFYLGAVDDTKTLKFMIRLLHRYPTSIPAILVTAHICSMRGSFGYALAEYFRSFGHVPKHPLPCLCIGLQYLFSSMSRRVANRHRTVLEAFTFLFHYVSLRTEQSSNCRIVAQIETKYNLARAFHYLGLFHQASLLYREILSMVEYIPWSHDLRRESAYNLASIYMHSGSGNLARHILRQYLTI
eukprot:jgi/Galph1/3415/GphlegSOOS_G2109.1